MIAYQAHCLYCEKVIPIGDKCQECLSQMEICPLHRPICGLVCPYKKQSFCDYPFIGKVAVIPDKGMV